MKSFTEICAEVGYNRDAVCPITPEYVWHASKNGVTKTCSSKEEALEFSRDVLRYVVNGAAISDWVKKQQDLRYQAIMLMYEELQAEYQNKVSKAVFRRCFELSCYYAFSNASGLDVVAERMKIEIENVNLEMENEII